jgi:hypothetical protein
MWARSLSRSTGAIGEDEPAIVILEKPLKVEHEIARLVDDALHEIGVGYLIRHEKASPASEHVELKWHGRIVQDGDRDVVFSQRPRDEPDPVEHGIEPAVSLGPQEDRQIDVAEGSLVARAVRPVEIERQDVGLAGP